MESEMMCHASRLQSPMKFEFSHHPLTMKRVVNLVVAVEYLKKNVAQTLLSTDFTDENLLSIMLESIIEEKIVSELFATNQFTRLPEPVPKPYYSVRDSKQRNLVLEESSMKLHAVMLQGGSSSRKVHLNMSTYTNPSPNAEASPVALCIKDTNRYLSCKLDGSVPSLHLEIVTDKDLLRNISSGSEMARFIFFKHDTGRSPMSSLRSAQFPEWYISTAVQDDADVPVHISKEASNSSTFFFQRQN